MRHAAEDFATALHDIETQARTGRLSDSPLSAVDEVVIAGAGWTRTMVPHAAGADPGDGPAGGRGPGGDERRRPGNG